MYPIACRFLAFVNMQLVLWSIYLSCRLRNGYKFNNNKHLILYNLDCSMQRAIQEVRPCLYMLSAQVIIIFKLVHQLMQLKLDNYEADVQTTTVMDFNHK